MEQGQGVGGTATAKPRDLAEHALRLASTDPEESRRLAHAALTAARSARDLSAESTAERTLGRLARDRHDNRSAERHFRTAVRLGALANSPVQEALARTGLMSALAIRGDLEGALQEAERAEPALSGADRGRLLQTRATVLLLLGRLDEALEGYRRALPIFRRAGDRASEASLLHNRGLVCLRSGLFRAAVTSTTRAEKLFTELGDERGAAEARQNLGWMAGMGGDVPEALAWFDRADRYFEDLGAVDPIGFLDRSEVFQGAGLLPEARRFAEQAEGEFARRGMALYLAQSRLMLSEIALQEGDLDSARVWAQQSLRSFIAQRRRPWMALARYMSVRVAWQNGDRSSALLNAARKAADALGQAGWAAAEVEARLIAGRIAIETNRKAVARAELVGARRHRRAGPAALRAQAWCAEAFLRVAEGNRRGAYAAAKAGMAVIDRYRSSLGATELRAHASAHAQELATLGMRLAIQDGSPGKVLWWAERWRAACLRLRPVRPPREASLADALQKMRASVNDLQRAALDGRDTRPILARQAALEEKVRALARRSKGLAFSADSLPPGTGELAGALTGQALVEIVELDGDLHGVVLTGTGKPRLRLLSPLAEVASELAGLQFALRRLARRHGSAASLGVAERAAAFAMEHLDAKLLAPLLGDIGDLPLVVVPTGVLHGIPWGGLPSCRGRAVTVAPSAGQWLRSAQRSPASLPDARVALISGPGLPHAAAEVSALSRRYAGAVRLSGKGATVEAVLAALGVADLAHIAAHSIFRSDNPLFSHLQLADGPLTVYDLEQLPRAPRALVLSACNSGLSGVRPGDELLGLSSALFSLGTATLVATVIPVPDESTRSLMLALHRRLRAGQGPASALAQALAAAVRDGDLLAQGFVCLGFG